MEKQWWIIHTYSEFERKVVTTWVVMVTVAFFGVFFFGVDSGVSWLVQRIIKLFAH